MHAGKSVTRERKSIRSTCSRITCLDSPLAAAQSLLLQDFGNWKFPNLKNYVEKNKRIFHEIGLKWNI
jgi:hypothetical protein